MKTKCEQCDVYFDPVIETVCDDCFDKADQENDKYIKSLIETIGKLKAENADYKLDLERIKNKLLDDIEYQKSEITKLTRQRDIMKKALEFYSGVEYKDAKFGSPIGMVLLDEFRNNGSIASKALQEAEVVQ